MPILDVKIAARESAELTQAVTSSLIELTSRILNKRREVTSIAITYLDRRTGSSVAVHCRSRERAVSFRYQDHRRDQYEDRKGAVHS